MNIKIQVGELESENRKEGGMGVAKGRKQVWKLLRAVCYKQVVFHDGPSASVTQVWTLLEGQRPGWQTVGDVRTLTSWRDPLFICGSLSHTGLHPPITLPLYEGPGIPKNWCPLECFPRTGICPVAPEYLLCIPFMGM